MAWTTPRDWTTGEFVTEAMMDTHIKDNFNAVRWYGVRKLADETISSNAVLQNDDHLFLPMLANEVWAVECVIWYTNSANANATPKIAWTVPASATGTWSWQAYLTTPPGSSQSDALSLATTGSLVATSTQAADQPIILRATVVNSATPGNLQLQWCQTTSTANNTTFRINSTLIAHRLA